MLATPLSYRCAVALARRLFPLYARFDPKMASGVAGRSGLLQRLEAWSARFRDPARPLLWVHAPSVGEGLQAEVVLRALRTAHPGWQIAYTFFSPSAVDLAARQPVDVADFLPWDTPADVSVALDALRPDALVFSKLDLWPELATRAAARGVAVGIIAATVSPSSSRLRWPARGILRAGYAAVTGAGAVSEEDAARLAALGVPAAAIEVTGDPRFDSVVERLRTALPGDPLRRLVQGAPTLVAGSTWAPDEDALLTAFRSVRATRPEARLILVPHEPTVRHLARLEARAGALGLPAPLRLSALGQSAPGPLLVVDRVGVLAILYPGAACAYVGGGFGRAGLHSVLEPAACAVPVIVGPHWQTSRDAALLLARGGATVTAGATPLAAHWLALLGNPEEAAAAGRSARECVEAGLGAGARSAGLVERLMLRGGQRPTITPS